MAPDADYSDRAATFGDRVAHAREARGMSQADLARKLGLRTTTIASWEEDRSEPRANKLQMLAGVLSVSMIWLMTGSGLGPSFADLQEEGVPVGELMQELRDIQRVQEGLAERLGRLLDRLHAAHEG